MRKTDAKEVQGSHAASVGDGTPRLLADTANLKA